LTIESWSRSWGNAIVGVVRLCREHGVTVLRGMRIADLYQRRGIGAALLRRLEPLLANENCYCLPFAHLGRFYSSIGFEVVEDGDVPGFLAERAARYIAKGEAISPMVRRGR
jgi:GNAT superfamily N-acetyltransferase